MTLVYHDERRWSETPVYIREGRFGLFDLLNQQVTLEQAAWVAPMDYRWRIGIPASQVYGYALHSPLIGNDNTERIGPIEPEVPFEEGVVRR